MKIKVCGMKYPANIKQLTELPVDFIGLIMYRKSPRYFLDEDTSITPDARREALFSIPQQIAKVGVMVNEEPMNAFFYAKHLKLDYLQFHGNESVQDCEMIKIAKPDLKIIKAFNVSTPEDFKQTKTYEDICDYFLFDTKTPRHGGSGLKFDWEILNEYSGNTPFFLSGGISLEDAERIKEIQHPRLYAVDLNSKFETAPGQKDIELVEQFIKQLKNEQD
ncbi:phosphoribosylanthranilate isomerase [Dysgonomonas sp.]